MGLKQNVYESFVLLCAISFDVHGLTNLTCECCGAQASNTGPCNYICPARQNKITPRAGLLVIYSTCTANTANPKTVFRRVNQDRTFIGGYFLWPNWSIILFLNLLCGKKVTVYILIRSLQLKQGAYNFYFHFFNLLFY